MLNLRPSREDSCGSWTRQGWGQASPPHKSQARKCRVGDPESVNTELAASSVPHKRALCSTARGRGWAVSRRQTWASVPPGSPAPQVSSRRGQKHSFFIFQKVGDILALSLRAHKRLSKGRQKSITRLARNCLGGSWARAKGREAIPGGPQRGLFKGSRAHKLQESLTRGCVPFRISQDREFHFTIH